MTAEEISPQQRLLGVLIHLTTEAIRHAEDAREARGQRRDELLSLCGDMALQMWRHWHIRLDALGLNEVHEFRIRYRRIINDSYYFIDEMLEDELVDRDGEGVAEAIGLLRSIERTFVDARECDDN